MTTGKTTALRENHSFDHTDICKQSDVSLLFSILSRFVIVFLPRNKCLSILWLQSPPAVILESKTIKSVTVNIVQLYCILYLKVSERIHLKNSYQNFFTVRQ